MLSLIHLAAKIGILLITKNPFCSGCAFYLLNEVKLLPFEVMAT
jgi:hypothetical protein